MIVAANTTFHVRDATYEEAEEIIAEPQITERVIARLGHAPIVPECRKLVLWGRYRMLFTYRILEATKNVGALVKAHIAVPKSDIPGCRVLALLASYWVLHVAAPEAVAIVVDLPEGKMSNMAVKLGYSKVCIQGQNVYVLSKPKAKYMFDVLSINLTD